LTVTTTGLKESKKFQRKGAKTQRKEKGIWGYGGDRGIKQKADSKKKLPFLALVLGLSGVDIMFF
jgi:hypothetical protein